MRIENVEPGMIEAKSFEIITGMLGGRKFNPQQEHVVKRCIHTSADFDYADNLYFSEDVIAKIARAFKNGCVLVTDTQMAKAGINKKLVEKYGIELNCFIADEDVADEAFRRKVTRASVAVEKAAGLNKPMVFAVGNAPTALIKLYELITYKGFSPEAVIGAPVGFVNVVESKEMIMGCNVSCIVAKGRKGGSNIAAAICNAILMDVAKFT